MRWNCAPPLNSHRPSARTTPASARNTSARFWSSYGAENGGALSAKVASCRCSETLADAVVLPEPLAAVDARAIPLLRLVTAERRLHHRSRHPAVDIEVLAPHSRLGGGTGPGHGAVERDVAHRGVEPDAGAAAAFGRDVIGEVTGEIVVRPAHRRRDALRRAAPHAGPARQRARAVGAGAHIGLGLDPGRAARLHHDGAAQRLLAVARRLRARAPPRSSPRCRAAPARGRRCRSPPGSAERHRPAPAPGWRSSRGWTPWPVSPVRPRA